MARRTGRWPVNLGVRWPGTKSFRALGHTQDFFLVFTIWKMGMNEKVVSNQIYLLPKVAVNLEVPGPERLETFTGR